MAFWTLQSKKVVDIAKRDGVYYPDFSHSPQIHIDDYLRVLESFNSINKTICKGLIFCCAPEIFVNGTNEYTGVEDIKSLFNDNQNISGSFAEEPFSLFDKNHVLLKINNKEFSETNYIPIDYWNHIIIMDGGSPEVFDFQKSFSDFNSLNYCEFHELICHSIRLGKYVRPIMPTGPFNKYNTMTEIHIPHIRFSDIMEIYEAAQLLE